MPAWVLAFFVGFIVLGLVLIFSKGSSRT